MAQSPKPCQDLEAELLDLDEHTDELIDPWSERGTALSGLVERAVAVGCTELARTLTWEAHLASAYLSHSALLETSRERFVEIDPDLLLEEALDYLSTRTSSKSAFVRARVRDFLWEHGGARHRREGSAAPVEYLETVDLAADHADEREHGWLAVGDSLVRAATLARATNNTSVLRGAGESALGLLRRFDAGGMGRQLMDAGLALIEAAALLDEGERTEVEDALRRTANLFLESDEPGQVHLGQSTLELQKRFLRAISANAQRIRDIDLAIIRSFIVEGDRKQEAGEGLISAIAYTDAVRRLELIGGEPALLNHLRAKVRESRLAGIDQMSLVTSRPIEIKPEQLEPVIAAVSDAPFPECLRVLALLPALRLSRSEVATGERSIAEGHAFLSTMSRITLRDGGQVLAPSDPHEAAKLRVYQHGAMLLRFQEGLYLNEILRRLVGRDDLGPEQVLSHLTSLAVIPEANLPVIEVGIRRLWEGDWISSIHILVPQLEDVLRHLVRRLGLESMRPHKIKGITLESTLGPVISKLADADAPDDFVFMLELVFDLYGYDLRNQVAHGLIRIGDCTSDTAVRVLQLYLMVAEAAGPTTRRSGGDQPRDDS